MITVQDAETYFDIDEFNDLYAKTKPTLYIKMSDIFSIHHLVASNIHYICPNPDDFLKEVVRDLGNVKSNESELMSVNSSEINLTLIPKLAQTEGEAQSILIYLYYILTSLIRPGRRCQGFVHGDQEMRTLYHSGTVWSQPFGDYGDATYRGRRGKMDDTRA